MLNITQKEYMGSRSRTRGARGSLRNGQKAGGRKTDNKGSSKIMETEGGRMEEDQNYGHRKTVGRTARKVGG